MKRLVIYFTCLWFRKTGWRFTGPLPKTLRHCVIVVGPHEGIKDFFVAIAVCSLTHFRTDIMVNEKYFRFPVKNLLHELGARPYNHKEVLRLKKWAIKNMRKRPQYSLLLTTQFLGKGEKKTDWYDIARDAGVPIVPVALDHRKKSVKIHSHFYASISKERDLHFVDNFLGTFK